MNSSLIKVFKEIPEGLTTKMEVVACHVKVNGKVLFLERSSLEESSGLWGLPAGKLEKGEDKAVGVLRELLEETGIQTSKESLKELGTLLICKPTHEFLYHAFELSLDEEPPIILSEEHLSYAWVPDGEWIHLPLLDGALEALSYYS